MAKHLQKLRNLINHMNIDGILIKSKTMKKYLGTLTGSGVLVLITKDQGYLILDGRYVEEAKTKEKDFYIIENTEAKSHKSHFKVIEEIFRKFNYSNLGIEGNSFSILEYENLKNRDFKVSLIGEELNEVRIIKDEDEIAIIREGCKITDEVFNNVIKHIKVGISENEINALVHYYSLKAGASKLSFDPVITSGPRTALPHGRPTNRKVETHEGIMIDFGIEYKNYQSDMTRMIFLGKPTEKIRNIYETVKKAQQAGVDSIKAKVNAKDVDNIVRNIIGNHGYGQYFNHGLGHGIGIGDGAEYPMLNQSSKTMLEDNMIMSCEPGIYVPNLGGVRIEDDVLIENGVGVPLNNTTKEIIILEA